MAGLVLLTAPAAPVVSIEEAQLHTRSYDPEEESLLEALVAAATAQAEAFCRRRFVSQTWRKTWDCWPSADGALVIPHPPLVSVQSVKYLDTSGTLTTLAVSAYDVKTGATPGRVVPVYGTSWPSARDEEDSVRVEFTCGYGAAAVVPDAIKRAILLIVGTLYANRETLAPVAMQPVPHSAEWLLGPYRVSRLAA